MFNPRSTRSPTCGQLFHIHFAVRECSIRAPRGARRTNRLNLIVTNQMFNPRSTRSPTAKTANRLSVFTPLLQHILQDFASIRHIQNACNGKKIKNQVRNSRRFRVRSGFAPVSSLRYMF